MTTTPTSSPERQILRNLLTNLGEVRGKRIAIDSVSGEFFHFAIELFKRGAQIVVSDRDKTKIQSLNRVLFEMSESANRYRTVPFCNIMFEPVDIFIALDPTESPVPTNAAFKRKVSFNDPEFTAGVGAAKATTQPTQPPASSKPAAANQPTASAAPPTTAVKGPAQPAGVVNAAPTGGTGVVSQPSAGPAT